MKARRCSGCQCLVKPSHDDNLCGWPCSALGFGDLFRGRVQSRRKWLARTMAPYMTRCFRKATR